VIYRIKYFAPSVLYVILIIFLSSLNQRIVSDYSWDIEDFILHGTEYHFYGVTLIWAILRDKPLYELKYSYRLAVGIGALSAICDEGYQYFIPSRYASLDDVVADVFGLILSVITFSMLMKIKKVERFRLNA